MTKSELKTGMIVTNRDGVETVVFLDATFAGREKDILVNTKSYYWVDLGEYREDLTSLRDRKYDIMKVEIPYLPYAFQEISCAKEQRESIWEREKVKEVTMAEVEEKFGCKVKIIK